MRYNARKKVSVYSFIEGIGEYGESIISNKELIYSGTELVCPMTSLAVKKEFGIETNNPKKIIFSKPLPKGIPLLFEIKDEIFVIKDITNFDKFNIILVDEV